MSGSNISDTRAGFSGSEMSSRMPLPLQAPPASPISGKTVMSWHWLVVAVVWLALMLAVRELVKRRERAAEAPVDKRH